MPSRSLRIAVARSDTRYAPSRRSTACPERPRRRTRRGDCRAVGTSQSDSRRQGSGHRPVRRRFGRGRFTGPEEKVRAQGARPQQQQGFEVDRRVPDHGGGKDRLPRPPPQRRRSPPAGPALAMRAAGEAAAAMTILVNRPMRHRLVPSVILSEVIDGDCILTQGFASGRIAIC